MPAKVKTARLCLLVAGWLMIATACLFLFIFVTGFIFVGGRGERAGLVGNVLLGGLGLALSAGSAAAGALDLIAAAGVRRGAASGRVLGAALAVLMLPLFPVGTILGLFVLSGLLNADARAWFAGRPAGF
jgi:hypothetical protein